MVLVQKWPFYEFLLLGNIGQENVFFDILERNTAFLGYKNKKFKKTNGFRPKMAIFPAFFYLGNKRQKNIFYDILERKSVFLEKKTKK